MFSEFIQMWQHYIVHIGINDYALQVNHDKCCGWYTVISVKNLKELKHSTMLEF